MRISKTWSQLKIFIDSKNLILRYEENEDDFYVWVEEGNREYYTTIYKILGNVDYTEFLETYKSIADKPIHPLSKDGKEIIRAESKPLGYTTVFAGQGDSDTEIGKGKILSWDFSNNDDLVSMPLGSDLKRKRIECKFMDSVYVKEGTLYFHNAPKGCYLDFYIVCPNGQYYKDNNGNIHQATEDTIVTHYVIYHLLQGTVPMGDELNTESCSDEIPNNYKLWLEITTLDSDNQSNGNAEIEVYRKRTVIL